MPHPFRTAAENKDLTMIEEVLREDVVLHSPILFRGFEGREATKFVLSNVIQVFEGFRYVSEAREGNVVYLRFKAHVGDKQIEGIDVLELDAEDKVAELTVFLRPLSAVNAFNEQMIERLGAPPPAA
jgi:hypothetical protein